MKEDEDIETMFSTLQVLVSDLQVLNKSYTILDHVKKILRRLPARYRPKVTIFQEDKDMNTMSLESLISNLQSHEMEMNENDSVKKHKSLALQSIDEKYGGKVVTSSKVSKSDEASNEEVSDGDSDDEETTFIIRRFQQL